MKHLTFKIDNTKEYKKACKEAQKEKYSSQLIQLFSGITQKKKILKILQQLHKDFPHAVIIGATTAGEISHATMYEDSFIVSLSLFKETKLRALYQKSIDKKSATNISKKLYTKDTKATILLSEGLQGDDYDGFIKTINKEHPNIILAGGLAGDNFKLKKTYIFLGTEIYDTGVIVLSLSNKNLIVDNNYNLNWTPIGKEFTITKSKVNIVYEIDNMSAVTFFQKYLGDEIFNDTTTITNFQLLYKVGTTTVARTPLAIENNAIVLAADIQEGQRVQFGFSNKANILHGAEDINNKLSQHAVEAIYIYSCVARKALLHKEIEKEFAVFEELAPTSGFFTYGEFYNTTKENAILNCTTTLLSLSESKKIKKKKNIIKKGRDLESATFNALAHFIAQTSKELQNNTQLLNQYKEGVDKSLLVSKTDINGAITYVNENFCKVSQYSKEELIGKNHNIIKDPHCAHAIFKKMWETILAGDIWKGIFSNRAKDGSIYYVDATIMPIFDEKHHIKEFIAIRQDITKYIKSNKKIQAKENLINAIFNNQDSIVLFSSNTRGMISVNKKLFYYLDYKDFEDFKSKHACICELFLEEEGYIYTKKYPNWIDYVNDNRDKEHKVKIITKDGIKRTFKLVSNRFSDDEFIINMYDITELENALHRAYASEQAKSQFLSNMSHEIRTPLNGIIGFTDVLLKKDLEKENRRYVEIIHSSGSTLLNVVNDILDYSKIESGELSLYATESNLFHEVESSIATFSAIAKQKHIEYFTYINPNMPQILKCDAQRIKQVINNLISNAMKFTPQYGRVSVSIDFLGEEDGDALLKFSVQDTGVGIAKEKQKTIFKAFSQADNSISREFGGTGLGLAISNRYIEMMGSNIQVKSELKKGSEFFFTLMLPIVDNNKALEQDSDKEEINKLHITIFDTNQKDVCAINKNITHYLDNWNIHHTTISNLEAMQPKTDILIICSQLFNQQECLKHLNNFTNLHIIFVEGVEPIQNHCMHERFHILEQPITPSGFFDELMDHTHSDKSIISKSTAQTEKIYQGHILVAEDNETNQMLISLLLDERDLHYTLVNNGQEAVDKIAQESGKYDLILMDINMPVLDGVSATKLLREREFMRPIVSLSANVIEKDKESFLNAGITATLNKPIVPQELDAVLEQYLKNVPSKQEKLPIEFDTVDIRSIMKSLGISNEAMVKKLLQSLATSLQSILKTFKEDEIDKTTIHKLRGVVGNMRMKILYELASQYENSIETLENEKKEEIRQLFIEHIKHLLNEL